MSKLDELINELCPDGVEYVEFDTVLDYEQPTKYIVESTNYDERCETPVLTAGQTFILGYTNEKDGIYTASIEEPAIIFDDFTTSFHWVNFSFKIKSSAMKILRVKANRVIDTTLRYVYHCMKNTQYEPVDHSRQWIAKYSAFLFPLPPLPVQEEIVRILDNFTELTAELTAELTLRKKQLEYYRKQLVQKEKTVKLSEICDIYLGLTATPNYVESGIKFISAQNTSSDYLNLKDTKYISEADYEKATSNAKPHRGDLLFTRVGSNLGHPVIVDTDEQLCIFVSLGFLRIKDDGVVINRYLKHWMNTDLFWEQVRKNVHGAAKVNLNTGWLKDFDIPLPSITKQIELCDKLDKLDKICTDFSSGLPAEIKARQQQYEYYKDKLLTFKNIDSEV